MRGGVPAASPKDPPRGKSSIEGPNRQCAGDRALGVVCWGPPSYHQLPIAAHQGEMGPGKTHPRGQCLTSNLRPLQA